MLENHTDNISHRKPPILIFHEQLLNIYLHFLFIALEAFRLKCCIVAYWDKNVCQKYGELTVRV